MKRLVALALGIPAIVAMSLALGPRDVRAGEKEEEVRKVEKRVVVRHSGGGRLGVSLEDTEGDLRGAKVRSVEEGSPAEKAGVKQGDVIARFDGEAVRSASHLARLVAETPAGRAVAIEVTRGGSTQKLSATLAEGKDQVRVFTGEGLPGVRELSFDLPHWEVEVPEPPSPPGAPPPQAWSFKRGDGNETVFRWLGGGPRKLGVEYTEIGEQLASYFKLARKTGVLVTSVDAEGPAAKAGMKAGDVILKLGTESIEDGEDLRQAVAKAEGGEETTVTVQRDGRPLDLKVTPAKPEMKVRRRAAGASL
jgi:serine protease Do